MLKRQNSKDIVVKKLIQISKKQDQIEKEIKTLEKITNNISNDTSVSTPTDKSWLKKFTDDCDSKTLAAVVGANGIVEGGISCTKYYLKCELDDANQIIELVKKTKTEYVTVECVGSEKLVTYFYKNPKDMDVKYLDERVRDIKKKTWHKFW